MARNSFEILIRLRDEASAQLQRLQRNASAAFNSLVGPSTVATTAVAGFATAATGAGLAAVNLAGQLEQSQIAFETLLGTAEAADSFLRDLADFAARTPFDFQGVQNATRLMLAFGFNAEQALPIVEALGDATSALGGSTAELEGVARAIGQIQTKGRLSQEELLQLAERGIPVFQILQEKLDLTGDQIGRIGELGIDAATGLTAILEGLSDRFAGAMQRQSATLLGLWSTIQDEISLTATDIGTKLIDALNLKDALETAIAQLSRFRDWVATLDLRQVFDEGREAVALMAGAIVATLLPSLVSLGLQVARVLIPIAAMAATGALVVDVARQLGVDFGELVKPSGVLARVASVVTGLVDVFRGVSTSIANLIKATAEGVRDWGEFFTLAVQQFGELFSYIGQMAAKSEQINRVLRDRGPLGLPEAFRLLGELDEMQRNLPVPNLAEAWNQAFQGTDEAILDGFYQANAYLTTGWEKIRAGFLGDVDDTVDAFVSAVTDGVQEAARQLTDWSSLLGGPVGVQFGDPTAVPGAGGSSRGRSDPAKEAADRVAAMLAAEVAGPGAGMASGMSAGAIRYRLRVARERAEAEARAVFDAYVALMHDDSRLAAMAAAEVEGPGAGMSSPLSPGAIRYRLRQAAQRNALAEAEEAGAFRDDRWRPNDFTLSSPHQREADARDNIAAHLEHELEVRAALVAQLTTITADKGPLANFGAALLGLVTSSIPAFDAALQGFVQGGPMGAVIGFFTELLSESQPFIDFLRRINEALEPLIDVIGRLMAPALGNAAGIFEALVEAMLPFLELATAVLGPLMELIGSVVVPVMQAFATVVRGVVDVLVGVWNFLFGWIPGLRVERQTPQTQSPESPTFTHSDQPPVTPGSLDFGGVGSGVQFGVAVPLREAGELHLTAARLQMDAATMIFSAAQLLANEGVNVNLAAGTVPVSPRPSSQVLSRAAIVR